VKKQILLNEADGETLLGYLETGGLVVLVFEPGYVVIEADDYHVLDTQAPLLLTDFDPEELASIGIGSVEEIDAMVAKIHAERSSKSVESQLKTVTASLKYLADNYPEAARQLIAESAEKYAVKP
jgi:hypothetical protein